MKCAISESTRCYTLAGTVTVPMDGTCMCGSNNVCDETSPTPACLLEVDGTKPAKGDKMETSCQVYKFCVIFSSIFVDQYIFICA